MRSISRRAIAFGAMAILPLLASACESNPHAWYRLDDYPGFSMSPVLDMEPPSVAEEYSSAGAPPRMVAFNDQLGVGCGYCHLGNDPRTCAFTPEGTTSRLMMDLSDRFKVECKYCHDGEPRKYTAKGKFAERDMRLPERRWKCAQCHDLQFKVVRH
jgi:hypothetical protein